MLAKKPMFTLLEMLSDKGEDDSMKVISHRGNIDGPNVKEENKPSYIDNAIGAGFDVEVDLRVIYPFRNFLYETDSPCFMLGHDYAKYKIDLSWLIARKSNLWVHCKNIEAFDWALKSDLHCFVHTDESYVFTSNGFVWGYPGNPAVSYRSCINVLPETFINYEKFDQSMFDKFYGVCSDYANGVQRCLEK